jgi:hypothetical protein
MSERVMEIEPALVLRDAQGMAASGNRSRVLEGPFVAESDCSRMSAVPRTHALRGNALHQSTGECRRSARPVPSGPAASGKSSDSQVPAPPRSGGPRRPRNRTADPIPDSPMVSPKTPKTTPDGPPVRTETA